MYFAIFVTLQPTRKRSKLLEENEKKGWEKLNPKTRLFLTQPMDPEKKSLNFSFPTKYVIPKSLKFSHWQSKFWGIENREPLPDFQNLPKTGWSALEIGDDQIYPIPTLFSLGATGGEK